MDQISSFVQPSVFREEVTEVSEEVIEGLSEKAYQMTNQMGCMSAGWE